MYQVSLGWTLVRQGAIFAENENKDKYIERDRYFSIFYLKLSFMYTKTIHSLPQSALYPNILSFLVRSSLQVKLWVLSLYIKLADISVVQIYNITFPFILCIIKHESSCSRTEREREGGNRQRVKVIKWSQGTDREREREKVVCLQKHCGGQEKRLRERDGWVKRRREWLPGSLSYGMSSSAAVAINYRQLGVIVTHDPLEGWVRRWESDDTPGMGTCG